MKLLTIDVDEGIKKQHLVQVMPMISSLRSALRAIRIDVGSESISPTPDPWAYPNGGTLESRWPNKPAEIVFGR